MEVTDSFLTLLQNFVPVFTAPTYQTFVVIVTGWIISQRHRYVTEVIFSSGRVGDGQCHGFIASSAKGLQIISIICDTRYLRHPPALPWIAWRSSHRGGDPGGDPLVSSLHIWPDTPSLRELIAATAPPGSQDP